MVLAKLAGRKTMTRRTVGLELINSEPERWEFVRTEIGNMVKGPVKMFALFRHIDGREIWLPCPYGQPGDVLYGRENLRRIGDVISYAAEGSMWCESKDYRYRYEEYQGVIPSIHMPKIAARIWDEVVSIRMERAQDISEEDAVAEGVGVGFQMNGGWPDYTRIKNGVCEVTQDEARMSFATLWESINGLESWKQNPWLWVLSTKALSTKGKPASVCQPS